MGGNSLSFKGHFKAGPKAGLGPVLDWAPGLELFSLGFGNFAPLIPFLAPFGSGGNIFAFRP